MPTVSVTSPPSPSKVNRLVHVNIEPFGIISDRRDSMSVSCAPLGVWSYRISFHDTTCVHPCLPVETLRNPQPYGEQTTAPLKPNGVSILALDPRLLIQYKLVTSLSSRRLAEISGSRTSATSHVMFILLPALVLTRKRGCTQCSVCDPSFETNSAPRSRLQWILGTH